MDKLDGKYHTLAALEIQNDKELLELGTQKFGSTAEFEKRLNRDVPLVRVSYPFNHPKTFLQQENGREQLMQLLIKVSDYDRWYPYRKPQQTTIQDPIPQEEGSY